MQENNHATSDVSNTTSTESTLLRVSLIAGLVWYSLLAYLIATSDPANVNIRQIAESDAVIRATVNADGEVHVDHVWRGNVENGPLDITFPEDVKRPGDFFIPLRRTAIGWEITPTRIGEGVRLVYPATDAVIEKMRELLDE